MHILESTLRVVSGQHVSESVSPLVESLLRTRRIIQGHGVASTQTGNDTSPAYASPRCLINPRAKEGDLKFARPTTRALVRLFFCALLLPHPSPFWHNPCIVYLPTKLLINFFYHSKSFLFGVHILGVYQSEVNSASYRANITSRTRTFLVIWPRAYRALYLLGFATEQQKSYEKRHKSHTV